MAAEATDEALLNISGEGRTLQEVIREVAVQSGYTVEVSESLLGKKISGRFERVDIDTFLTRIFRGENIFQVIDHDQKKIKLFVLAREKGRILRIEADNSGGVSKNWLDSKLDGDLSGKNNRQLMQERDETFESYDPAEHELDGESDRTTKDLLDEREETAENYDESKVQLDGEADRTTGDLLEEREREFAGYDSAEHVLDGEPERTEKDLLDERDEQYQGFDPNSQPLDGEPDKTFQDLLDERERVFN